MNDAQMIQQHINKVVNFANAKAIMVTKNLADIFIGNGWREHSRYRKAKDGGWSHVSGVVLPARDVASMNTRLVVRSDTAGSTTK